MSIKSYYRLTKPGIIYGNLLTAAAGYFFASHWHNNYSALIGLLVGLGLIIGASCVANNVIDRDIDLKMERTKNRSTVTGDISKKTALRYAAILGILGAITLIVFTNFLTFLVGLFGVVVYLGFYSYAKRKSVWGTLVGGLAGAVPPIAGYAAYTNYLDQGAVILLFVLICWQLAHFYGIALYRKQEYKAAGIPVWPVIKGDWNAQFQALGAIGLFTIFSITLFFFGYTGFVYLAVMLVTGIAWFWYAVFLAGKLKAPVWGRKVFLSSLIVMIILCLSLAFGPILP
jgi:protoheme IX farnesyltransferase